jgi:ABC-type polysaccharide/polyol phosphate export permease
MVMKYDTSFRSQSPYHTAIADIMGALRQFNNTLFLAGANVKLRYKRSVLGPLWITLTTVVFIFFISYLYTGFIETDFPHYLTNLSLGWIIWQFINDSVVQGAQTFQRGARVLHGTRIDKFSFVLQMVFINLIILVHNLLIVVVVLVMGEVTISPNMFFVIPGFALIVLSAIWSATLFGILCARYRDLYPTLQAGMRVLFFVTPILWSPALLPADSPRRLFVDLNPFAHYVEICRKPLMGESPPMLSWLVTGSCTVVGLTLAFLAFARYRRNIVFWV